MEIVPLLQSCVTPLLCAAVLLGHHPLQLPPHSLEAISRMSLPVQTPMALAETSNSLP